MRLANLTENNRISPEKLAERFSTTKRELGLTLGIPAQSLSREERIGAARTQQALRRLVEIINAIEPVIGNAIMAFAWFRSEPIPGFGGRTPEQIVKDGEFEGLRAHIQRRLQGGYA